MSIKGAALALTLSLALPALGGCSVEIVHDLEESEANEILAALHARGIFGDKLRSAQGSKASYTVSVGRDDAVQAWQVLRRQNLPRPKRKGLGEVFGKAGLIPTATQERAMMHHALAGELSRTLQSVEGVLEARVHVVLAARDPLAPADQPRPGPKASVLLRSSGGTSPLTSDQVQRLVAGAVKELKPEAVSVVFVHGGASKAPVAAPARVGPFSVAPGSRGTLLATLVGGVVLVVVLALGLLLVVRRNRRLAVEVRQLAERGGGGSTLSAARLDSSLSLLGRSVARGGRSTAAGRDSSG